MQSRSGDDKAGEVGIVKPAQENWCIYQRKFGHDLGEKCAVVWFGNQCTCKADVAACKWLKFVQMKIYLQSTI